MYDLSDVALFRFKYICPHFFLRYPFFSIVEIGRGRRYSKERYFFSSGIAVIIVNVVKTVKEAKVTVEVFLGSQ